MSLSNQSSDERIAFLRGLFDDYIALPRHTADREFQARLKALQTWEAEDIRRRHCVAIDDDRHYRKLLDYYLSSLHNGLGLQGMVGQGPDSLENARKLNKAYELFANAIEFSVLTASLQDRLVNGLGDAVITTENYAAAMTECDDLEQREQRLELLVSIGHLVAPHIDSRLIHTGFKMLKGLFRNSGMAEIHSTLDEGFRQLRGIPRLAQQMARFAETEKQHLHTMTDGDSP